MLPTKAGRPLVVELLLDELLLELLLDEEELELLDEPVPELPLMVPAEAVSVTLSSLDPSSRRSTLKV
jgi:hypothetical protein